MTKENTEQVHMITLDKGMLSVKLQSASSHCYACQINHVKLLFHKVCACFFPNNSLNSICITSWAYDWIGIMKNVTSFSVALPLVMEHCCWSDVRFQM